MGERGEGAWRILVACIIYILGNDGRYRRRCEWEEDVWFLGI